MGVYRADGDRSGGAFHMSFLDRFTHPVRRTEKAPVQAIQPVEQRKLYLYPDYLNPVLATDPDLNAAIRLGTLVHGPGATEAIYGAWHYNDSNSAVFACLSAIATAYPEAPAKVYKQTDVGERDELPLHPLKKLLDKPNPYMTREDLWHYTQWCKHVGGNAYWRKVRTAGNGTNIIALWPISPLRIQPVTTKEDAAKGIFISFYAYTYDPAKDPELIAPSDIVHFRLGVDDKDHRIGCSPLQRLIREVTGDDEAHAWQAAMLSNGGSVGMLIQVPIDAQITQQQAEDMKAQFEERFGGNNRGRTGVLTGGAKAEPYGFSPEQMDMKSLHRIPEERISAVMRVPAIIAGLGAGLDRSTYANFREAREAAGYAGTKPAPTSACRRTWTTTRRCRTNSPTRTYRVRNKARSRVCHLGRNRCTVHTCRRRKPTRCCRMSCRLSSSSPSPVRRRTCRTTSMVSRSA